MQRIHSSPLSRGRMKQAISFSRCTGIRVVVTPVMKSHEAFRSRHRSSSDGAGGGGRRRHDQSFKPRNVRTKKRKAERRQTRSRCCTCRCSARLAGARSPGGVPPRFSPKGLSIPKAHLGPGFVRGISRGGIPADIVAHFQRCTSRVSHSADRLMPETPGSGGDEPPPAGTASRSTSQGHRLTSFT